MSYPAKFIPFILSALLFCAASVAAQQNPSSKTQNNDKSGDDLPVVRSRSDLVTLAITVTDENERYAVGLEKDDFEVYDDNVLQTIEFFSTQAAPVSLGIVFDVSGSMKGGLEQAALKGLNKLFDACGEEDEFFMVGFNNAAKLVIDFTPVNRRFSDNPVLLAAKGSTALYDGVYLAAEKMRQARHKRRALIILSDGQDNSSRYTNSEVRQLLKEMNILIYAIGGYDYGYGILKKVTELTGGRVFSFVDIEEAATRIGLELHNQYGIGFTPSVEKREGSWHKLKVKLKRQKGLENLKVRTREGYYGGSLRPDEK